MILPYSYYQQSITPIDDIKLNVNNLSLHRGYGIFDYFTYHQGQNKYLDWYISRLYTSAAKAQLTISLSPQQLVDAINLLYEQNRVAQANIKIIITAGNSTNGYQPLGKPELIILSYKHQSHPSTHYTEGIRLITYEHRRPFADIKSTNYMIPYLLQQQLNNRHAVDVLYHMNDQVSETSRANIFLVKNQSIFTPSEHILPGITRRIILESYEGHKVTVQRLTLNDFLSADEVFITSSTKRIMPVIAIDNQSISNSNVGPISQKINQWFIKQLSD